MTQDSERNKIKLCRECGAAFLVSESACPECNSINNSIIDELTCVPLKKGHHFQFSTALSYMLQEYAGKKCKITIEVIE